MKTKSKKHRRKAPGSHLSPQRTFAFTRRDGHRIGRKPSPDSGVSHQARAPLASRFPVHVVLRIDDRFGFRLNHYSVPIASALLGPQVRPAQRKRSRRDGPARSRSKKVA